MVMLAALWGWGVLLAEFLQVFCIGFAAALALSYLGSRLWLRFRDLLYRQAGRPIEGVPPEKPSFAVLGFALDEKAELVRKSATNLLDDLHQSAILAQNSYHSALAMAVAATLFGFLGFSAALTLFENDDVTKPLCSALDVSCFGLALLFFFRAMHANRRWIRARIKNELMRQWCVTDNLLIAPPLPDVTTRFCAFAGRVDEAMSNTAAGEASDWIAKVRDFWRTRRRELGEGIVRGPLERARIATHFSKRPWTQMQWFARSRRLLLDQSAWRSRGLLCTFSITVLLSFVKLWLVFSHPFKSVLPVLEFSILTFIGISSALTALYLSQNARSLIHRYESQSRQIQDWMTDYEGVLAAIDCAGGPVVPRELAGTLAEHVLRFEDLMIEELLDWISISENDVIELSP